MNSQHRDSFPLAGVEQGDRNHYESQIHRQTKHIYLKKKKKPDVKSLGNHEFHLEHGDLGIKCLVLKDNWLRYYTFFD